MKFINRVLIAFVASRLDVCASCAFRVDMRAVDGC
jgi:hypothetical protein